MSEELWTTFPALSGWAHGFTLRHPSIEVDVERAEAVARLRSWHGEVAASLGFGPDALRTAEQVHGSEVAVVDFDSPAMILGADGLVTGEPGLLLGIYVADCAAVFLADRRTGAVGLVHSGRQGTELRILPAAIRSMVDAFGTRPEDLVVQLSPCIRPPAYEVDFAADLRQQALCAGVDPGHLHDGGVCTSSDLSRYYSYRLEKGRTGRMLALLGRLDS